MLDSPVQAASSLVASSAQLTSCTAWRQAVQIQKHTHEGSRRGLLDSPEHTDSSQLAFRAPLWPLAGPGDVALQPRLFWIPKWRSEGSHQRSQDWNLKSFFLNRSCLGHDVSPLSRPPRCPSCLLQDLEMWRCSPGCSGSRSGDLKVPARGLRTGT